MRRCRRWLPAASIAVPRETGRAARSRFVGDDKEIGVAVDGSWLAKVQCGMENTSCCDHSKLCSPICERPEPDTTRQIMLQVVRFGRVGAFGKPHRIAVERRHHRAAGLWIGVAHGTRAVGTGRQGGKKPPRRFAGIAIFRRMRRLARHVGAGQAPTRPIASRRLRRPARTGCCRSRPARRNWRRACGSSGMLAASNQMMRWSLSLTWPCQHIGGVRIRSPSCMSQRRPLTIVAAPSARVAKRIAAKVCRCGRARSPGSSTVKAAIRFEVVTVSPANAGFTRISARRSTSSIATSETARSE